MHGFPVRKRCGQERVIAASSRIVNKLTEAAPCKSRETAYYRTTIKRRHRRSLLRDVRRRARSVFAGPFLQNYTHDKYNKNSQLSGTRCLPFKASHTSQAAAKLIGE